MVLRKKKRPKEEEPGAGGEAAPPRETKKRLPRASLRKAKKARTIAGAPEGSVASAAAGAAKEAPRKKPAAGGRDDGGGAAAPRPAGGTFAPRGGAFAYDADPDDHCETDVRAYRHLRPLLLQLGRALHGGSPGDLRLWDPYYCNGAVARNLASLGFPKVHNVNEDFYEVLRTGQLPEHDVLVTSPPYSGDHIERCMRHCAASSKPWCVLLPNWVHQKDFYQELLRSAPGLAATPPLYLGPVGAPYRYWFPEGAPRPAHVGADGKTTPYSSCWHIHMPASIGGHRLLRSLEAEQKRLGEWVVAKTVKGLKWTARNVQKRHAGKAAAPGAEALAGWGGGGAGARTAAARKKKRRRTGRPDAG